MILNLDKNFLRFFIKILKILKTYIYLLLHKLEIFSSVFYNFFNFGVTNLISVYLIKV